MHHRLWIGLQWNESTRSLRTKMIWDAAHHLIWKIKNMASSLWTVMVHCSIDRRYYLWRNTWLFKTRWIKQDLFKDKYLSIPLKIWTFLKINLYIQIRWQNYGKSCESMNVFPKALKNRFYAKITLAFSRATINKF